MLTSERCLEVLSALLAARLAFPPIPRTWEAWSPKSKKSYLYADLNGIIDATVPVLGAHGLLMVQSLGDGEGGMLCLTSTLFHVATGQWIRAEVSATRPENMQDYGAACTYLKRYAQQALLNISTETDDDAASLNGGGKPEKSAAAENPRPNVPSNGTGHSPGPEAAKGSQKPMVQKFDLLKQVQSEITRLGRPVGEVTALYRAAFGDEVSTWDLVCGESLHTLKHGLAYLKTLTPEAPDGIAPGSAHVPAATATPATTEVPTADPPPAASAVSAVESSSAPEPSPDDTVESLVQYAVGLGLQEDVTRRVIHLHKDLTKCRRILTDAAERNKRQVA